MTALRILHGGLIVGMATVTAQIGLGFFYDAAATLIACAIIGEGVHVLDVKRGRR